MGADQVAPGVTHGVVAEQDPAPGQDHRAAPQARVSAVVQVTVEDLDGINIAASDGDCSTPGDALQNQEDSSVTPSDNDPDQPVEVDVVTDVNASPDGSYEIDFTAGNLGAGDYVYCFTVTADDGAERKDGSDDNVESVSIATKDFTWQ